MYDTLGNEMPVGHKNGFCVLDLCGAGGYNCSDMGISAGCYDAYGLGTGGQWIDITDVPDGVYTFVARVNWENHPDIEGRVEVNLSNNWQSRCMQITRDLAGEISVELLDICPTYIDCLGEIWGTAHVDCEGNCNGWHDLGDLNLDTSRTVVDVNQYIAEILDNTIIAEICNDANNDSNIDVVDAALVMGCSNQGLGYSHDLNLCALPVELMNLSDTVTYSIGSVNPA
ncbi:MAG: lysyl oxidase family protein, partial [Chitinophagales bacterium]